MTGIDPLKIFYPKKYYGILGLGQFTERRMRFAFALTSIVEAMGKTSYTLAKRAGIQAKTMEKWLNAKAEPKYEQLALLIEVLELDSFDSNYLVGLLTGYPKALEYPDKDWEELIKKYLDNQVKQPAYILDHKENILAANKAIQMLYGIPTLDYEQWQPINILEFLFDEQYDAVGRLGEKQVNDILKSQILRFRASQVNHRHQEWYINLTWKLASKDRFRKLWTREPKLKELKPNSNQYDISYEIKGSKLSLDAKIYYFPIPGSIAQQVSYDIYEEGELRHIFISYNRKDISEMRRLREALEDKNFKVWVDENIEVGTSPWVIAIEDAIESASCVILLLSPASKASEWVSKEIIFAQERKKTVIPVAISGTDDELRWLLISGTQRIDFRGSNHATGINELCEAIQRKLTNLQNHEHLS